MFSCTCRQLRYIRYRLVSHCHSCQYCCDLLLAAYINSSSQHDSNAIPNAIPCSFVVRTCTCIGHSARLWAEDTAGRVSSIYQQVEKMKCLPIAKVVLLLSDYAQMRPLTSGYVPAQPCDQSKINVFQLASGSEDACSYMYICSFLVLALDMQPCLPSPSFRP